MPRLPNVPKPSAAARAAGKPPTRGVPGEQRMHEFKAQAQETCPLCIEELDCTDLQFSPCPCGYRVCLFCYEQLKIHCQNQCPGCRREYGKGGNFVESKAPLDMGPDSYLLGEGSVQQQSEASPAGHSGPHASHAPQGRSSPISHAGPVAKANIVTLVAKKPIEPAPAKRGSAMEEAAAAAALPSGATWGAVPMNSMSRQQSVDSVGPIAVAVAAAAAVDDSAWPSLASTTNAPPAPTGAAPTQNGGSHRQHRMDDMARRHSMSISTSSMDGEPSSSSLDQLSQDPNHEGGPLPGTAHPSHQLLSHHHAQTQQQQQQQQHAHVQQHPHAHHDGSYPSNMVSPHLSDAFASAQVFSTVQGVRRAVNVPLGVNGAPVQPYNEAPALLANMQHAVKSGALSSKDAATRLIALLREKERDVGGGSSRPHPQSALASGRTPPGFAVNLPSHHPLGPSAPHAQSGHAPSLNPLNNLDNPVVPGPPQGRYSPISPPMNQMPNGGLFGAGAIGSNVVGTSGQAPIGAQRQYQPLLAAQHQGGTGQSQAPQSPTVHSPYQPLQRLQHNGPSSGTYSVWSGLPGIDLGTSSSPFGALWQGTAQGQAPSNSILPMGGLQYGSTESGSHSGCMGGTSDSSAAQPAAVASKQPPPGFGLSALPPPGFSFRSEISVATSSEGPQLKSNTPPPGFAGSNGVYNPLQAQLGALRNGGVSVYRPQLGAL